MNTIVLYFSQDIEDVMVIYLENDVNNYCCLVFFLVSDSVKVNVISAIIDVFSLEVSEVANLLPVKINFSVEKILQVVVTHPINDIDIVVVLAELSEPASELGKIVRFALTQAVLVIVHEKRNLLIRTTIGNSAKPMVLVVPDQSIQLPITTTA